MKKEILFAIFIGLSLGLIITYGAYRARKSEQDMAAQTTDSIASSPGSESENQNNKLLSLFSPEDESIQNTDDIKITGTTTANSFVVIFIGDDENITTADDSGNFSIETKLEKGSNIISVHAINEDGEVSIEEKTVIFTTADIGEEKNSQPEVSNPGEAQDEDSGLSMLWQIPQAYAQEEDASPAASETTKNLKERIERVVKEREEEIKGTIEDLSSKKQGFIGEVERVSGETLSVKTIKDTRIIAINDDITLLKNNKEIEIKDIAVGDWLIAMGLLKDDNFVAKRIIVSAESLRPKNYKVALGSISQIGTSSLEFTARSESDNKTLTLNKSVSYQDLDGNKIAASLLNDDMQALVIYYEDSESKKIVTVIRALSTLETDED